VPAENGQERREVQTEDDYELKHQATEPTWFSSFRPLFMRLIKWKNITVAETKLF
jgi:hypothetical protein